MGIQRRKMDNYSTLSYTENNYTGPILPENPIRYSETNNHYFDITAAPFFFVLSILIMFLIKYAFRGLWICIQNISRNKIKKQNTNIVAEMKCKECKEWAGSFFCKHKMTPV